MRKFISLAAAGALLAGTLCSCGNGSTSTSTKKGRYVESIVSTLQGQWLGVSGSGTQTRFYVNTSDGLEGMSLDGKSETTKTPAALASADVSITSVSSNGSTTYYLYTNKDGKPLLVDSNGTEITIAGWAETSNFGFGQANRTPGAAPSGEAPSAPAGNAQPGEQTPPAEPGNASGQAGTQSTGLVPQQVLALEDGFLLRYRNQTDVVCYDAKGTKTRSIAIGSTQSNGPGTGGNRVGMGGFGGAQTLSLADNKTLLVPGNEEIATYDLASGIATGTIATTGQSFDAVAAEGDGYVGVNSSGLYSVTAKGECTQLADGNLSSLVSPALTAQCLVPLGDQSYALLLAGQQSLQLSRFAYDKTLSATPTKTLTVFALQENETLRLAMGAFQRSHPDVQVQLEIGLDDSSDGSATSEDVIRALNTQLLAGNGPDVLVLDGLPLQSYIEKGVLQDLTALSATVTGGDGVLTNLSSAYASNGKTYGLPTRFAMPVMLGSTTVLKELTSVPALTAAIKTTGATEPYLLKTPSELYEDGGVLMRYYEPLAASFALADGSLDETALATYLQNAADLDSTLKGLFAETDADRRQAFGQARGGRALRMDTGVMDLRDGKALAHTQTISNAMGAMMLCSTLGSLQNQSVQSLFGLGVFLPKSGVGINAASTQKTLAEEFVQTCVSADVQDNYMYDALPVRLSSLKLMLSDAKERMGDEFNDMGLLALAQSLSTPALPDARVQATVQSYAKAVADGSLTPQAAATKIVADSKLYLAE